MKNKGMITVAALTALIGGVIYASARDKKKKTLWFSQVDVVKGVFEISATEGSLLEKRTIGRNGLFNALPQGIQFDKTRIIVSINGHMLVAVRMLGDVSGELIAINMDTGKQYYFKGIGSAQKLLATLLKNQ